MDWVELIRSFLTPLLVAIILFFFQRKSDKKTDEAEKRAAIRKEESLLGLNMNHANGKLAFATAMALKQGHMNGELETAVEAYADANAAYEDFMRQQTRDLI